jgi:sulfate adenylyltransferase
MAETTEPRGPESDRLNAPSGGRLINLVVSDEEREESFRYSSSLPSISLSERQLCDLELLATGAFSPLESFMGSADLQSVVQTMRLADGHLFPMPITLSVEDSPHTRPGQDLALRTPTNDLLGFMHIDEIYEWDRKAECEQVLGTEDERHPLVAEMYKWGPIRISGKLTVVQLPQHRDFRELRLTPADTRERLAALGHSNVVAFQTRNPLHRAHEEMTKRAIAQTNGALLLHPVVGLTKWGDVDYYTRVRAYKALSKHYEPDTIVLSLLPLAMRFAGPREALWHAIIRRNFGASHMIIGRDHASPGQDSNGKPFYQADAAKKLAEQYSSEIGVEILSFDEMVYLPDENRYEERSKIGGRKYLSVSGTQVRDLLSSGKALPDWFTRPEVAEILAEGHKAMHRQGACVWFTGLSGAGKSTTAEILTSRLLEHGRQVTVLDGDVVRTNLSKGLGFTKEDRDTNVRRIAFVAAEVVRHGGVAVCAAVSPYRATRNDLRNMIGGGKFVEVFVDTPLDVCEFRDSKGMYSQARAGKLKGFTGIDDPYEAPLHPEITIDGSNQSPAANAGAIFDYLVSRGFIRQPSAGEEKAQAA